MAIPPPPPGFQIVSGGGSPAPVLGGRPIIRRGSPPPKPQPKVVQNGYIIDPNTGDATPVRGLPPQGSDPAKPTKGQEALDKLFAQDYAQYTAGGGFSDVQKQLGQLREVSGRLKSGQNLTGPVIGMMPDAVNAFVNPDAIAVRESVEEPVQRTLRQILGAQYTEKEGERIIARAYNPRLSEAENRKRVARLRIQLTLAARAKQDAVTYFEKNGTLTGWKGHLWSAGDLNPERATSVPPPARGPKPPAKGRVINFDDLPE